jgi:RimJ/RimL family protein N-acetyltransferase
MNILNIIKANTILRKMERIITRKPKRSDFAEYYKNELSYYKELKKDPKFGIGTYGKKLTKKDIEKSFSKLLKASSSHKSIVLVAVNEKGNIVGIGELNSNAWPEAPHIADIGYSVVKEYRGKGIGKMIVKELLNRAKDKYEIITARTFSSNIASKRLLKKFGFKRWGLGPKFVKRGKL